ncbi:MAG TPA: hypothetical protein VN155_16935 [Devosia sp.]|nr:hypothetical protein [Devosia sp.]
MKLTTQRLAGGTSDYFVPSFHEALNHSRKTAGVQFDPIERKNISGGLPMVWPRAQ